MLKVFKTLKWREWLYAVAAVGFIVLQVWLDLTMPDYMSEITQLAVMSDASVMGEIWKNGGLMLACALGSALSSVAVGFFAARIASATCAGSYSLAQPSSPPRIRSKAAPSPACTTGVPEAVAA